MRSVWCGKTGNWEALSEGNRWRLIMSPWDTVLRFDHKAESFHGCFSVSVMTKILYHSGDPKKTGQRAELRLWKELFLNEYLGQKNSI